MMKGEATMSENKKLTQEEVAALLIRRAKENTESVRALQDDDLDSVAGGYGSYTISDKNGECVAAHCGHQETSNGDLRKSLHDGMACAYGQAAGATTCDGCQYFSMTIEFCPMPYGPVTTG
jgi:hypothetical protein